MTEGRPTSAGAGRVSHQPTDGLSYDPSEARYWEPGALEGEIRRVVEICHECRMCFKYCDTFPSLFALVDAQDGNVGGVASGDISTAFDQCFQCKLCEVQCPYTPRDGHEYQLDFPKLVHRHDAHRIRREGPTRRDKVLGDPDKAGRMARGSFGLANVMNRVGLHRWFMEKFLGIHRAKDLPDFAGTTFEKWARKNDKLREAAGAEAVLFQTCYVQHNEPQIGRDTVEVMEHNGVDLACVKGLKCCGMPAWEHGDIEGVRESAAHNLDLLMPHVEAGAKVVVINPTCSMMMRREYPDLLDGEDRARGARLAEAIADASEYLWSLRDEARFRTDFKSTPGAHVAYHAPCHLRAQAIGFRGRDLLRKIPGVKPAMTMECCGHDGTYAMTVEGFEPSQRIGAKAFQGMKEADAEVWVTDCPLAALQFGQHAGRKPMHPMSVLAKAYRDDGFPERVEESES
jgi:Fe-S oxidoreductase